MAVTRWGIIGPGDIAHNFADGLKESEAGKLTANPLGIALAGCPLDEKISEMHAVRKRGDAIGALGGDPDRINPLVPAELVIDHSVQVDVFGQPKALAMAVRNHETTRRFSGLKARLKGC